MLAIAAVCDVGEAQNCTNIIAVVSLDNMHLLSRHNTIRQPDCNKGDATSNSPIAFVFFQIICNILPESRWRF